MSAIDFNTESNGCGEIVSVLSTVFTVDLKSFESRRVGVPS